MYIAYNISLIITRCKTDLIVIKVIQSVIYMTRIIPISEPNKTSFTNEV